VPLQLPAGVSWQSLNLDGTETVDVEGLRPEMSPRTVVTCTVRRANGTTENITLRTRLDTRREIGWYTSGGILNFVFDQIRSRSPGVRQ
jgi:aconitate hydratase